MLSSLYRFHFYAFLNLTAKNFLAHKNSIEIFGLLKMFSQVEIDPTIIVIIFCIALLNSFESKRHICVKHRQNMPKNKMLCHCI